MNYADEELLGMGDKMSADAEEMYNYKMLAEAQRIIDGDSIMVASSEHVRCLLDIIHKELPHLVAPSINTEPF